MKTTFKRVSAFLAAAIFVIASCTPVETDTDTDNNGLKPDNTEQNGNENTGNENTGNENTGNENNGGNENTGGNDGELHASLQGSEYVPIALDEYSAEAIKDKVKAAYYVDDTNVFYYIWEGTYNAGTSSGLNFYGEAVTWTSLVVGNVGWSGAGWCVTNPEYVPAFVSSEDDIANWKLHLAYKGAANVAHCMILYWCGGEYKFAIGQGTFEDSGVQYPAIAPVSGEFQANAWNEYEISLADTGFDYSKDNTASKANLLAVLSGGTAGTTFDIDAIFFYKK